MSRHNEKIYKGAFRRRGDLLKHRKVNDVYSKFPLQRKKNELPVLEVVAVEEVQQL